MKEVSIQMGYWAKFFGALGCSSVSRVFVPSLLDDWYCTRHHGFEPKVSRLNRWTIGLWMDFSACAAPYMPPRKHYICLAWFLLVVLRCSGCGAGGLYSNGLFWAWGCSSVGRVLVPALLDDWYCTRHHGFEPPVGRLNRWTIGL